MTKLGFYFDQTSCLGCRTCQVACCDKHNLEPHVLFRSVSTFETGAFPAVGAYHYSGACNHCENPKCVKGCPTGAMYKAEDGTVQHNDDKCIGCKYCIWNCPYGVPQFLEGDDIVKKCDSCKDLRDEGGNPACVDSCVARCLEWGDLEELKAKHGSLVQDLPILPSSSVTTPSVLIKPKKWALSSSYAKKEV